MDDEKLTYNDVSEYESLFGMAPPFLLEIFAKKNKNLVLKFEPVIRDHLNNLNDNQQKKLDLLLNTDIDELQSLMRECYHNSNKKQYKILGNPKYREFIENNMKEIRKMI